MSDYSQRDIDLWTNVFGSGFYPWVWSVDFEARGDWDTPGSATIVIANPDGEWDNENNCPAEVEGRGHVTIESLREALDTAVRRGYRDACTGKPIHEDMDWDVCSADTIIQLAVLGTVVFG